MFALDCFTSTLSQTLAQMSKFRYKMMAQYFSQIVTKTIFMSLKMCIVVFDVYMCMSIYLFSTLCDNRQPTEEKRRGKLML